VLRWRLLSAAVLISGLLLLLWLDYRQIVCETPGLLLLPLALGAVSLGVRELLALLAARGLAPRAFEVHVGVIAVVIAAGAPLLGFADSPLVARGGLLAAPWLAFSLAVLLLFVGEMARYREPGGVTQRVASGTLVIAYLGVLGSFLVLLRQWQGNAWGMAALVSMIIVVKLSDAGAYFAGRLFGKNPMAPLLSPKKTIEGGAGGILASVAGAGLCAKFLFPALVPAAPPTEAWRWIVYGVLLAVTGMTGDLAESLIKRDVGHKDAGKLLPGMGGVLDVLDSLLFGAPVAYACWLAGLLGPTAS
jgi:phosphatidate cytidylyltransferase